MLKFECPVPLTTALLALLLLCLVAPSTARAGNIFDFLFGGEEWPRASRVERWEGAPRRFRSHFHAHSRRAANFRFDHIDTDGTGANTGGFCVRTCDGYYFPLIRSKSANPQQSCEYACPSAVMAIYQGSSIENARDASGQLYSKLPTAFHFQDRTTSFCSCSVARTAILDYKKILETDPTLRRGDIVISESGVMAFQGGEGPAAFMPIDRASFVSNDLRRRIRSIISRPSRARMDPAPDKSPTPDSGTPTTAAASSIPPVATENNPHN